MLGHADSAKPNRWFAWAAGLFSPAESKGGIDGRGCYDRQEQGTRQQGLEHWRRRRSVFATSWKVMIPTGRTPAIAGKRSITIFLHAITTWPLFWCQLYRALGGGFGLASASDSRTGDGAGGRHFKLGLFSFFFLFLVGFLSGLCFFFFRLDERTRIARELHDTLLQSFHGLMFRFQAVRNMLPGAPKRQFKLSIALSNGRIRPSPRAGTRYRVYVPRQWSPTNWRRR